MVTEYCRGCIYLGTFHAYEKCCDYILMTKRRRPCPSGDGCTAKKTREGTALKERAWDTERAKALLIGGSSYTATADAVGCKVEELKSWMKCEQNRKAAWLEDYKPARGRGRAQKRALVSGSEAIVAGGGDKERIFGAGVCCRGRTATCVSPARGGDPVHGLRLPHHGHCAISAGSHSAA